MGVTTDTKWEANALARYQGMVKKMPLFHREIAKQVVDKKAIELAKTRGSAQVEADDIVQAFFSEVPMTFYSLMIRLLDEAGFDYKKYERK